MNILITGIHGFVGTNLVNALVGNNTIYGLDIIAPEKKGVEKTFSWNDMTNDVIPQVDAIIHLAGKAHDIKNKSKADVYFTINTGLTQKIFDYYLDHKDIKKFIFFSSVKAAADFVLGNILTEDVPTNPVGPYGESKIKAEEYIINKLTVDSGQLTVDGEQLTVAMQHDSATNCQLSTVNCQLNKQVYILRPCMIHGPGNKGNLNLLYNVVKKGIPWPLGAFENRRSFTSIDNLCYVIEGLLTKDVPGGIYHMGDDEAMSTNELIATMCEVMGKKPHIWKMNKGLMEGCAGIGTLLHLPLNTERLRKLTENYVVSNDKIKRALGIDKMPVTAKEGLIKTICSFIN